MRLIPDRRTLFGICLALTTGLTAVPARSDEPDQRAQKLYDLRDLLV